MSALDEARALVLAHGGEWSASYGRCPGPGHGPEDRSLKVYAFEDQVYVHSFCGDDWRDCRAHLGLADNVRREPAPWKPPAAASPSRRVKDLVRTASPVDLVADAVGYLKSRNLWPLPEHCTLKAHPSVPYWDAGDPPVKVGRFPALLAPVRDIEGDLVTLHVTYLKNNAKLSGRTPRKLLSSTTSRVGCAVRLVPEGPVLAVAEGVESALAAQHILRVPCWAALNTSLLVNFKPPSNVKRLVIAADRDIPGLVAAWKLRDRIDMPMELRVSTLSDFAEDLER